MQVKARPTPVKDVDRRSTFDGPSARYRLEPTLSLSAAAESAAHAVAELGDMPNGLNLDVDMLRGNGGSEMGAGSISNGGSGLGAGTTHFSPGVGPATQASDGKRRRWS